MTRKTLLCILAIGYLATLTVDWGFIYIRANNKALHYRASRRLAKNQRLTEDDLTPPENEGLFVRVFGQSRKRLTGQLLLRNIEAGESILPVDVSPREHIEIGAGKLIVVDVADTVVAQNLAVGDQVTLVIDAAEKKQEPPTSTNLDRTNTGSRMDSGVPDRAGIGGLPAVSRLKGRPNAASNTNAKTDGKAKARADAEAKAQAEKEAQSKKNNASKADSTSSHPPTIVVEDGDAVVRAIRHQTLTDGTRQTSNITAVVEIVGREKTLKAISKGLGLRLKKKY